VQHFVFFCVQRWNVKTENPQISGFELRSWWHKVKSPVADSSVDRAVVAWGTEQLFP